MGLLLAVSPHTVIVNYNTMEADVKRFSGPALSFAAGMKKTEKPVPA